MTSTLNLYLSRLFLLRVGIILFGVVAMLLLLDLLRLSDDIARAGGSVAASLGRYLMLRLPVILSKTIPLSVLLGALITLIALVRYSELVAVMGAGVSRLKLVGVLLPAALLVAVGQFLVEDQALPRSVSALRAWGVGDYEERDKDAERRTWVRQGTNFVSIGEIGAEDGALRDVVIFHREADGRLIEQIAAEQAVFVDGTWKLEGVTRTDSESREAVILASLVWPEAVEGALLRALNLHPRELGWNEIRRLREHAVLGSQPSYLYDVWLHKKISRPLATVLMVLLAVACVQRLHPRQGAGIMFFVGVGAGFVYWVADELVLTVGEAGLLPAALAAWAPPLVLAAASASVIFQREGR